MNRGIRRGLIAAMCGALVLAFAGIAAGKTKTKTFSSGTVNEVFGGPAPSITQDFDLNKKRFKRSKVKDVDVSVRISHSYNNDIDLFLTAPNGRQIELSTDNGADNDDNYGSGDDSCAGTFTTFNDEAETPIVEGTSPFAGQFTPEERLSGLDRGKVKGVWRLRLEDDVLSADDGTLHCAALKVKYRKKAKKH